MSILEKGNRLKVSDAIETPDVDVTPMMNVLMILLPILITMAVFTKIAMLSFSLPPNVNAGMGGNSEKPRLRMTVVVAQNYYAVTLGDKMLDSIPITGKEDDYRALKERILSRKQTNNTDNEAVVAIRDKVRFQCMVRVMDICRESGFEKIGVSSATENADRGA